MLSTTPADAEDDAEEEPLPDAALAAAALAGAGVCGRLLLHISHALRDTAFSNVQLLHVHRAAPDEADDVPVPPDAAATGALAPQTTQALFPASFSKVHAPQLHVDLTDMWAG